MSGCQKRGFYLAGFKVETGEATAHLPEGTRRVVTSRAKPDEVNVQELPDGTLIDVPRVGLFAFDASAIYGRSGRAADLEAISAALPTVTRARWLRRIATSRTDRAAFLFVLNRAHEFGMHPGAPVLRKMTRACRAHWSELPAIASSPEARDRPHVLDSAIQAVSDPSLLVTLANLDDAPADVSLAAISQLNTLGRGDLALEVARAVIYEFDSPSSPRFSRYGLDFDISHAILTFEESAFRSLVDEFLNTRSAVIAQLFATTIDRACTEAVFNQSRPPYRGPSQETGIVSSAADLHRSATHVLDLLRNHAHKEPLSSDVIKSRIEAIERGAARLDLSQRNPKEELATARAEITMTSTEDLIQDAIVANGPHGANDDVLFELARRRVAHPALLHDKRYVWVRALHDTGRFSRDVVVDRHHTNDLRSEALPFLPRAAQLKIANDEHEHPNVRRRALTLLGDLDAWERVVLSIDHVVYRRHFLEHTPLDVLAALTERPIQDRAYNRDIWEVAVARAAIPPETAISHPSYVVRRSAVARSTVQPAITRALDDESSAVVRTALAKSRDEAAIHATTERLRAELASDPELPTLLQVADRRLSQLTYHRLAELSVARGELSVARAAIAELRHRDLLFDLLLHPGIESFVAARLQQVQRAPRRR
jgi:hypothetical protein